jgi:hypothetical protein
MARYVVRRQLTSYLHPNTVSAPADCLTKENFEHNGNTIKYLKSPSVERNAGDFSLKLIGSPIQMNKYKECR